MRNILPVILFLMSAHSVLAQQSIDKVGDMLSRSQVDSAILVLRPAVLDSATLSAKERITAHYRLSEALMRKSQSIKGDPMDGISEEKMALLTESYRNAETSRRLAKAEPSLTKHVNEQIRKLKLELTSVSNKNFQGAVASSEDTVKQNRWLEMNRVITMNMLALDSTYYMAYDYLAQTLLGIGDSAKAIEVLQKGIRIYERAEERAEPDLLALQMYPRLAKAQMGFARDTLAAERTVADGLLKLDREENPVTLNSGMTDKRREIIMEKIGKLRHSLRNLSMIVVLNNQAPTPEHVKRFTDALERNPDDLNLQLAYAKILSHTDPEASLRKYEELAEIAEYDVVVLYSAGAMYSKRAAHFSLPENRDENQISSNLVKAFRYFERAEVADPKNFLVIKALVQITERLGQKSRTKYYEGKLRELSQ